MRKRLLLFVLAACIPFGDLLAQSSTPADLDQAVGYFLQSWPRNEQLEFRKTPEAEAVAREHFSTGSWIRDTWIRGNTRLAAYFDSLGITHPTDMSAIVLTSLHRKLNGRDLQLARQVDGYKQYWNAVAECDAKLKAQAVSDYSRFAEGQEITIYFPVDTASADRNAVVLNCPRPEWTFNDKRDLVVKARIVKKLTIDDPTKVFFEIEILSLNRPEMRLMSEKLSVGGRKLLPLYALRIESAD